MTPSLEQTKIRIMKQKIDEFLSGVRWQHLLAGTLGGVAATSLLHPLDLVKVRLQVNESSGTKIGMREVAMGLFKEDGLRGLYRGVTPNIVGAGLSWGFYFYFYNELKQQRPCSTHLDPISHMAIASQAGIATLFLTNPIWVVKTRMCLQNTIPNTTTHTKHPEYRGMVDCAVNLVRKEGVSGLYKGLVPGLFGVSHGAVQFMSYEQLKIFYNCHHHRPPNHKLTSIEYLTFAAISKIIAATTTYPYQVVRSRLQNQHTHYNSTIQVIKHTYQHEGLRGFFKGLVPGVLRVTPACCITFLVYENVINYLTN